METILIITYDMIPYSAAWGACQRMYFLAEYLQGVGKKVFVIHSKKKYFGDFGKQISFESIPVDFNQKVVRKFLAKYYKDQTNKTSVEPRLTYIRRAVKSVTRVGLSALESFFFNEPNIGTGILGKLWAKNATTKAIELIEKYNVSKIIISAPPFSILNSVIHLRNKCDNVSIIVDYRDPWNVWNNHKGIPLAIEKKILQNSDFIVFASRRLKEEMIKRFPFISFKTEVVSNGYSSEAWAKAETGIFKGKNMKLTISHVGSISFRKDSCRSGYELLEAFSRFSGRKDSIIRFVGINRSALGKYQTKYSDLNLEFTGSISHIDSLRAMLNSDILVAVHSANDESGSFIATAKFYDYLRSGKPIIGIGKPSVFFNRMIIRHGVGLVAKYEREDIIKKLEYVYGLWKKGELDKLRTKEFNDLYKYSREYQNRKYLEIIENV